MAKVIKHDKLADDSSFWRTRRLLMVFSLSLLLYALLGGGPIEGIGGNLLQVKWDHPDKIIWVLWIGFSYAVWRYLIVYWRQIKDECARAFRSQLCSMSGYKTLAKRSSDSLPSGKVSKVANPNVVRNGFKRRLNHGDNMLASGATINDPSLVKDVPSREVITAEFGALFFAIIRTAVVADYVLPLLLAVAAISMHALSS